MKSINKGKPIEILSEYIKFDSYLDLPKNYKTFYGVRFCGVVETDNKPIFYGFDLFYQISGCGLDLENFLTFSMVNGFHIDWYNFQRTSIERGNWSYETLIKKLKYPILDVFGKEYWENLEYRFKWYQLKVMNK